MGSSGDKERPYRATKSVWIAAGVGGGVSQQRGGLGGGPGVMADVVKAEETPQTGLFLDSQGRSSGIHTISLHFAVQRECAAGHSGHLPRAPLLDETSRRSEKMDTDVECGGGRGPTKH